MRTSRKKAGSPWSPENVVAKMTMTALLSGHLTLSSLPAGSTDQNDERKKDTEKKTQMREREMLLVSLYAGYR